MSQPPAAVFERLSLHLGGRTILREVSLTLPRGAFIGILGPNGAGKTTLLRAMLGLMRPDSGTLHVLGMAPHQARRRIGYMPQTRTPLSDLHVSGHDFVAAAASPKAWPLGWLSRPERHDVARAIEAAGAAPFAHRPISRLSGGERQRLLLAQALLGEPELLLLDEPLISLDPHYQAATVAAVQDLQRRLGLTVCFTAHEINPLLPALDQVLYLGHGQAAIGAVREVMTPEILSRLYATKIDVFELQGRLFVMADGHEVERDTHAHL